MRVSIMSDGTAEGQVDLIGNSLNFSKAPMSRRYRRPSFGAHTQAILEDLSERKTDEKLSQLATTEGAKPHQQGGNNV